MKTIGQRTVVLCTLLLLGACGESARLPEPPGPGEEGISSQMKTFADQLELEGYLKSIQEAQQQENTGESITGDATAEGPATTADSEDSSNATNQEITNNQEAGVEEGGLVKNYRNFLVILRRGRLVTVRVEEDGSLAKIDQEEMTPEGLDDAVWYDELLVSEDRVLVIGYRYSVVPFGHGRRGATELNLFEISEGGSLQRLETYFFESNDYFSWKNYAGRLIEGKLVLYFPFYQRFLWEARKGLQIPRIFRYTGGGRVEEIGRLFEPTDIYRPLQKIKWPTFHTLLICDVTASLTCSAQGIVDSWFRELYVTPDRAYLWIDDSYWAGPSLARLYAIALDGSESGVAEVEGSPIDQFSLDEREDGIDALTVSYEASPCDSQQWNHRHHRLVRVNFSDFGPELKGKAPVSFCLPGQSVYANRFGPSHLVYGGADGEIVVVERESGTSTSLPLGSYVERIEKAGDRFLIVGPSRKEIFPQILDLSVLEIAESPRISGSVELFATYEAEWRSHGYSFLEGEESDFFGLGTLEGMAVATDEYEVWDDWAYPKVLSSVSFFRIGEDGTLAEAGRLEETTFSEPDDGCTTSCVDWYGNTRPIFLDGHLLGLIGDQMVSGHFDPRGTLKPAHHLQLFTGETR